MIMTIWEADNASKYVKIMYAISSGFTRFLSIVTLEETCVNYYENFNHINLKIILTSFSKK